MENAYQVTQGDLAFGLSVMQQLGEGNLSVSPTSLRMALSMLYEGAAGETAEQVARVARLPTDAQVRQQGFSYLAEVLNAQGKPYSLRLANGIWTDATFPVKPNFENLLKGAYQVEAAVANFVDNADQERERINRWVYDKTDERIPELFPDDSLNENTALALVNALAFDAPWDRPFDPHHTRDQEFTLEGGKKVQVPMMRKGYIDQEQTEFGYHAFPGFESALIPYEGLDLAKLILLPNEGVSLKDFQDTLVHIGADLNKVTNNGMMRSVKFSRLEFPKHSLSGSYELVQPLFAMGVSDIFDREKSDLSKISYQEPLWISSGFHETRFETDEKGSRGAAATGFGVARGLSAAKMPVEFVVNRPYLEALIHQPTKAMLFVNRVENPL